MVVEAEEPNPSSNWISLGPRVKLKFDPVYNEIEHMDLKNAIHFSACSFGGPIALARSLSDSSWKVSLKTSAGHPMCKDLQRGDIVGMEWTRGQRLVILDRRGCVSTFTATGRAEGSFYLAKDVREVREFRCFHHGTRDSGLAVLDDQQRIFVVNTVTEPIPWTMHTPSKDPPTAWTAIHPQLLTSIVLVNGTTFYLGHQGEPVQVVDTPWAENDGQYVRLSPNWEHSRFAVYHSSRIIQVISLDLSKLYQTIRVPGEQSIYRLGWVGFDAIFLQRTPNFVQFFPADSSGSDAVHEFHCDFVQIGVEPDGVKIFTNDSLQYVSPVSDSENRVLGVAVLTDGLFLYEASQLAEKEQSTKAYEYMLNVKEMNKAIAQCLDAARHVTQPRLQKALLKAAHFGVPFTSTFDSSSLVSVIRNLRILNEVRRTRTGVAITYQQLELLSTKSLVNRLVDLQAYGVAVRVSSLTEDMQQEGVDAVILAWVRSTLETAAANPTTADVELLDRIIAAKFKQFPHVSFADAAKKAIDARLPRLARLLIARETDEERQVEVLLRLHDVGDALKLAAQSQRPELMHIVIRHLIATKQKSQYELEIQKIPQARCLYAEYVTQERGGALGGSGAKMLALLEQGSDFDRKLIFHLDAACQADPALAYDGHAASLRKAKEAAGQLKDPALNDLMTMAVQQVSADWNVNTVREQVINNAFNTTLVQQLKSTYKLTEKQIWLWTIEGLAKNDRWEQLFDMTKKKPPVGYVPFLKACLKYNRRQECDRYMGKINVYPELVQAHLLFGDFVAAAKLAFDRRDAEMLNKIHMKSHKNRQQYQKVGQLVMAL